MQADNLRPAEEDRQGGLRRRLKRLWQAFCAGAGSINLFPPSPHPGSLAQRWRQRTSEEAWREDAAKLRGDWQQVGDDLRRAMAGVDAESRPAAKPGARKTAGPVRSGRGRLRRR